MSKIYLNFLKNILNTLNFKEHRKSSLSFFRKDNISLVIYCNILINYYNNNPTFIEELIKQIHNGSRITIKKKIDDAISFNYLTATKSKVDRRKIDINPTKETIKEFEAYVDRLKNSLN